jgi:phytoene synthase
VVNQSASLERAYAHCEQVARDHYENFPVASRLLPRSARPHIAAIYAFARRADDYADEPGIATAERFRLLDEWESRLLRAIEPRDLTSNGGSTNDQNTDELVFAALGATIRRCHLPPALFTDLLSAFRQDITVTRYATWTDVLDYCRRSANPVGRLVLRVAGYDDPRLDRASDSVCTALQLTNFWQDLGRDWDNGRLYVPQEDLIRTGATEADLANRRLTPEWKAVVALIVERTRELFDLGREVCDGVRGRLKWELRLTWLGGTRILEKVAAVRRHSLVHRPTLGAADIPALCRDAMLWKGGPRRDAAAPIAG